MLYCQIHNLGLIWPKLCYHIYSMGLLAPGCIVRSIVGAFLAHVVLKNLKCVPSYSMLFCQINSLWKPCPWFIVRTMLWISLVPCYISRHLLWDFLALWCNVSSTLEYYIPKIVIHETKIYTIRLTMCCVTSRTWRPYFEGMMAIGSIISNASITTWPVRFPPHYIINNWASCANAQTRNHANTTFILPES